MSGRLKDFLEEQVDRYNRPDFIMQDPIQIPHRFKALQDIEIMGLWTSILSWGQRSTIIAKASQLVDLMDGCPYDFILNHSDGELSRFLKFRHRTFQPDDALYFLDFFRRYYKRNQSLEAAFIPQDGESGMESRLRNFHRVFFHGGNHLKRTEKHVSTPARNATCKRLNMFLRWMVRKDDRGVDFGVWRLIKPSELMIPLDVHVDRVARGFGLLMRNQTDWKAVVELTANLRSFDPEDPVKYDFALFGLGVLRSGLSKGAGFEF